MEGRQYHCNYYRDHREEILQKKREKIKAKTEEQKKQHNSYMVEYRKANKEKISAINKAYRDNCKAKESPTPSA